MDFEIDVMIDESALDVEWLNQPSLAIKYGRNWAECYRTFQQAEENVKLIRSELIKEVLTDPDEYLGDGIKPTAPAIEAYYRTHKKHKKAKEKWVTAQYELNMADIAKKEIAISRKLALQNLVELHGQNYFAGPNIPRELSYERTKEKHQKKVDGGVAKKMKRNKKE